MRLVRLLKLPASAERLCGDAKLASDIDRGDFMKEERRFGEVSPGCKGEAPITSAEAGDFGSEASETESPSGMTVEHCEPGLYLGNSLVSIVRSSRTGGRSSRGCWRPNT